MLFVARIISQAALKQGLPVVMNEIHGLAQRGGTILNNVRIGDAYSPYIPDGEADVIVSAEPHETLRVIDKASAACVSIVSEVPIYPPTSYLGYDIYPSKKDVMSEIESKLPKVVFINPISIAQKAGSAKMANVVMLGALIATHILPLAKKDILSELKTHLDFWSYKANKKAFVEGYSEVA